MLRYTLQCGPRWADQAEYALRLLFEGVGAGCARTELTADADVVYSPDRPRDLSTRALWIPAAALADWDVPTKEICWIGETPVIAPSGLSGDWQEDSCIAL